MCTFTGNRAENRPKNGAIPWVQNTLLFKKKNQGSQVLLKNGEREEARSYQLKIHKVFIHLINIP